MAKPKTPPKGAMAKDPPKPPAAAAKPASQPRDPREMDRYKRNQDILKTAAPGSPEYTRAYEGLKRVGELYGLNWQQHVTKGAPTPAPTPETTASFPGPTPLPPDYVNALPTPPEMPGGGGGGGGGDGGPSDEGLDFDALLVSGLGGLNQQMGYAQEQGAFKPGDFSAQMEAARKQVMDTFQRRSQEEFGRQDLATQQAIVERGLDPNSEAAQALMRANTQRQDLARQEAMSAAEQAAQGVQAQAYGQQVQTYQMPFQNMGAFMPFYQGQLDMLGQQRGFQQQERMAGVQAGYEAQAQQRAAEIQKVIAAKEQEYKQQLLAAGFTNEMAAMKAKQKADEALVKLQARLRPQGGGGAAAPNTYDKMLDAIMAGQGGAGGASSPSTANVAIGAAGQTLGAGLAQTITK